MDGFGSHTYQWVNAAGERFWVKYHFKTNQGIEFLTQAEADRLAGTDPDYHRADLHDAIERGEFPSWTLKVQIMPVAEAEGYRFNPFDLTKVWSQRDYPLIEIGTWTLNRNPRNFFAEIEQAAFAPSNIVPGIGLSPDKMLLGRVFSYADAHRYRLGANHAQLPVNAPRNEVNSYSRTAPCGTRSTTRAPRCMRRTASAARTPTRRPPATKVCGSSAPRRCGPATSGMPRTTTSVRPARWSARCSTTRPVSGWWATSSATSSGDRGGVVRADLRILVERRRRPRQEGRGGRAGGPGLTSRQRMPHQ